MVKDNDATFEEKWAEPVPWKESNNPPKEGDFVIHASQGQGDCVVGGYPDLESALEDCRAHFGEMSLGVVYPNGDWHKWSDADCVRADRAFRRFQEFGELREV